MLEKLFAVKRLIVRKFKNMEQQKKASLNMMDNLYKTNVLLFNQFKQIVDMHIICPSNSKFYGQWVWKLIFHKSISPYLVEQTDDYLKDNIFSTNIPFDYDDYNLHRAFIEISFRNYNDAIFYLEKIPSSASFVNDVTKWKTFDALLSNAITKYSTGIILNTYIVRNYPKIWLTPNLETKEFLLLLVKMQQSARYWNNLSLDTAYAECSCTISFAGRVFENQLKAVFSRMPTTPNLGNGTIGNMQTALENSLSSSRKNSMNRARQSLSTIASNSKNPSGFAVNWPNMRTIISTRNLDIDSYAGKVFEICRIVRNNSQHAINFQSKLFSTKQEFAEIIDTLIEGIFLATLY